MLYEKDIIFDFVRHIYDILFRITGKKEENTSGGEKRWYRQSCTDVMDTWAV